MKKLLSYCVFTLLTTLLTAQVSKTVNVTTAGTLTTLLTTTERSTITNLTLTGTIDDRDVKYMRDSMSVLTTLDLNAVIIAGYTGSNGTKHGSNTYVENVFPDFSFYYNTYLTKSTLKSIILPTTISSVGVSAFDGCTSLVAITIPHKVTSIGIAAFQLCSSLTAIDIPSEVDSIGSYAFGHCSSLTSITIPTNLTSILDGTFTHCTSLTSLTIPKNITSIGSTALNSCSSLTSIYAYQINPINLTNSLDVFGGVKTSTCVLYVPTGSKSSYKTAVNWSKFTNIVEMATAVPTILDKNVLLSPNPVKNELHINGLIGNVFLKITDINGRIVFTKSVSTTEVISVASIPHGIYFVKIITTEGTVVKKIIKE